MPYQGDFLFGVKVWASSLMVTLPAVVGLAVDTFRIAWGGEPFRVLLACFV